MLYYFSFPFEVPPEENERKNKTRNVIGQTNVSSLCQLTRKKKKKLFGDITSPAAAAALG
jgi:hypothetical protein